ncbi:MAG: substrate-binding domain-containing protein, partial [Bacteroidetes bacterium]|nr:substrate-binding domain-containing protein [Bacteroidota bacterium]
MFRTPIFYLLCTLIVGFGCSQQESQQPASLNQILQEVADDTMETSEYTSDPPYTIGFSNASMGNPWRAFFDAWIRCQVDQYEEIENLIRTDAQDDPVKQISDIEDLLAQGVDLLIVSATDQQALAPAVENAMSQGVPVVLVDRGVRTEEFVSFIGASDSEMGRIMAEELARMIDQSGSVVMLSGVAGSSPVELRLEA